MLFIQEKDAHDSSHFSKKIAAEPCLYTERALIMFFHCGQPESGWSAAIFLPNVYHGCCWQPLPGYGPTYTEHLSAPTGQYCIISAGEENNSAPSLGGGCTRIQDASKNLYIITQGGKFSKYRNAQ
ncbi:hypothetical protein CHARACLAT_006261 [Characodon lateralis]|uniref:Uncharacterized protein n=1 Tax=Characodon lateralis TaxID=208331 RepID=A0ABU7EGT7_9TELE|nr:hypothetical protein [Characodon lateralis]